MPSSCKVKSEILRLLKKHKSGNIIYELGSGWGTLVFPISNSDPEYQVIGIEYSLIPYLFSQLFKRITQNKQSQIQHKNFFDASLKEADVVICYLCTGLMAKLKKKFEQELKEGAVVISSTFAVPEWEPVEIVTVDDWYRSKLYVYRKS